MDRTVVIPSDTRAGTERSSIQKPTQLRATISTVGMIVEECNSQFVSEGGI